MATAARHSLTRTALSALVLALFAIAVIARQTGAAAAPQADGAPAAAFIPQGPVTQHRERGNLVFDGIPPSDSGLAARLARYQQSRGATFLDWRAGGGRL